MILSHEQLQSTLQIKQNSKMINYFRDRGIAFMLDGQGKCITSDHLLVEFMGGASSGETEWEFE